jgi:hypothetical protein
MLFSQRKGIKPVKEIIQIDSVDDDLRNCLWNALTVFYWRDAEDEHSFHGDDIDELCEKLWHSYFKRSIDALDSDWTEVWGELKGYFFRCAWNEVYDFIEFIANNFSEKSGHINADFMIFCNKVLERELSAYRFVDGKITEITSEEEIKEIEEAMQSSMPLKPVKNHLKRALELLADRKAPDYRNSIKESISAVESLCNLITKKSKTTLGQALKELEGKVKLHAALKSSFSSLYGYTNDAEGIRHALLDEPSLSFEDAKFMLVSCSSFINYLVVKSAKAEIKL